MQYKGRIFHSGERSIQNKVTISWKIKKSWFYCPQRKNMIFSCLSLTQCHIHWIKNAVRTNPHFTKAKFFKLFNIFFWVVLSIINSDFNFKIQSLNRSHNVKKTQVSKFDNLRNVVCNIRDQDHSSFIWNYYVTTYKTIETFGIARKQYRET